MATGISFDGKVVAVNDQVSVMGKVASHSGTGSTASLTVTTLFGDSITVPANNAYAPQTDGALISIDGKGFSDTDKVTVPGVVTAVGSGTGQNAQLTVKLQGGTSVTVTAGACRSTSQS
jgi:hypothetical protein